MEPRVNSIKQIVSEESFEVIPNLTMRCEKLRLIEEAITIMYPNHKSSLWIATVSPPYVPKPKICNNTEYTIFMGLTSLYQNPQFGPKFFMDYGKLVTRISQLYKVGCQVGAFIFYEMSSCNGTLNLFCDTTNKNQWLVISQEGGESELWLDIRQYKKWYINQRKITVESMELSQRDIEEVQDELVVIEEMFNKKRDELFKTLDRLHDRIKKGVHFHFVKPGKLEKSNRLEQFLCNGEDKTMIDLDPMSYITLLQKITNQIDLKEKYDERKVKASYQEEEWLNINIHLSNQIVRQIKVILPMLNLLEKNLETLSNKNKGKIFYCIKDTASKITLVYFTGAVPPL